MTQFLSTPVDKSLTTTGAWTDIDLSGDVPASASGAVFLVTVPSGVAKWFGLRKNGSSDDIYKKIWSEHQQFAIVGLDATRKCEGKISNTDVDFHLIGYTEGDATFFTNAIDKSLTTTDAWTDIDLSSNIPSGSIAAIFKVVNTAAADLSYGLRKNGSSDDRKRGSQLSAQTFIIVGVDATRKCEGYISSTAGDFYLLGYLTGGQTNTNAINRSLGTTGSYIDIDESSDAPANATGVFGEVMLALSTYMKFAARKNGTSFDFYNDCYKQQSIMAGLDANRKWEGKIESVHVDFFTMGYFGPGIVVKTKTSSISMHVVARKTKTSSISLYVVPPWTLDSMDATTGWSTDGAMTGITVNTTTKKEGSGALNLIKANTSGTDAGILKAISAVNLTSKHVKVWLYLKDATAKNKIATTEVNLVDNTQSSAQWHFSGSSLNVGWNLLRVDTETTPDYTENPDFTNITEIQLYVNTNQANDTYAEGDVIADYYHYTEIKTKTSSIGLSIVERKTKTSSIGLLISEQKTKTSSISLTAIARKTKTSSIGLHIVTPKTKESSIGMTILGANTKESSIGLTIQIESEKVSSIGTLITNRKTKSSSIGLGVTGPEIKESSISLAVRGMFTKESSIGVTVRDTFTKESSIGLHIVTPKTKESSIGMTILGANTKESSIGLYIADVILKESSIGMCVYGSNTKESSIGVTVSEKVLKRGFYYAKLGSTALHGIEVDNFRITKEINQTPVFEFEIANCEANRTAIASGIEDELKIYWKHETGDMHIFTGIINADGIEYLSLDSIEITGYASYVVLSWPLFKHLADEDAEDVNKVFVFDGTYTDYTTEANNAAINDVPVSFADENHGLYIGEDNPFWGAQIKYSTKGVVSKGPVFGTDFDITIASGTSTKTEFIYSTHPAANIFITDLYFEIPTLATPAKTAKLELLTARDNIVFSSGDLDASIARDFRFVVSTGLKDVTKYKVTTDANVTGAKTFNVEIRGFKVLETSTVLEYSKGTGTWGTLDALDESDAFTEDPGTYDLIIPHLPSDWARNTVGGINKYWLRYRVTEGSYLAAPKLDQIHIVNVDVYRAYYFDTSARAILLNALAGTDYTMDTTDSCPEDLISIIAEYETPLRVIAAIPNALTWTDGDGNKKAYQWWIDDAKKVHIKQQRGTTQPHDITGEMTIFNNHEDYFHLSNQLHGLGPRDGLSQMRAIIRDNDSITTHKLREIAVVQEQIGKYNMLKESLQKKIAISKDPMQRIRGSVSTVFWNQSGYEVGDTVTLHQDNWNVSEKEFQIVKVEMGPNSTILNLGISQEHLEGLRDTMQRQLTLNNVRMHGSTTILQAGPETENYQRKSNTEVYPAKLTIEIPSEVKKIHKVLISWTLGNYRASVKETTGEGAGHDHGGYTGAGGAQSSVYAGGGGAFTPDVLGDGGFTPQMLSEAHIHKTDAVINITHGSGSFHDVVNDYVHDTSHRHTKGRTGPPDDITYVMSGLTYGCDCSEACGGGHCVYSWSGENVADSSHWHLNTGLYTGYTAPVMWIETIPRSYVKYINPTAFVEFSLTEDPAHLHDGVYEDDHDHTGVYQTPHSDHLVPSEPAHDDHIVTTDPGSPLEILYGIHEEPGGSTMELLVNDEKVGQYTTAQTEIRIDGYLGSGSNTIKIQPIVGVNTKGGATIWGSGTLFMEPRQF